MRVRMKALRPAATLAASSDQKPMRANEQKPTPSQPRKRKTRSSAMTIVCMLNTNRFR